MSENKEQKTSQDEFVTLEIREGTKITIKKAILIKSSLYFRAMLEDKNWKEGNENKILIKEIPFEDIDPLTFMRFFTRFHKSEGQKYQWSIGNLLAIFSWAHYYQVDFEDEVMDTIIHYLTSHKLEMRNVKHFVKFVNDFNLENLKVTLYTRRLLISKDNCLEYYKTISEYENESWINQIVDFAADNLEPDETWPIGLLVRGMKKLKSQK